MTRALVTRMLRALDASRDDVNECINEILPKAGSYRYDRVIGSLTTKLTKHDAAITSAREYLATEPSGERADSAQWLREFADMEFSYYSREATQLRKAADMLEADAQPKQVTCQIYGHVVGACVECNTHIEAQQAKRVPLNESEDLYALALKADNWGQP